MNCFKAAALTLALLLIMQPTLLYAQPSSRFPQSVTILQEGTRYEGFALEGFVELLRIDAELQSASAELVLREATIDSLTVQLSSYTLSLQLTEHNLSLMTEDRDRLSSLWEEQNQRLNELENKPKLMGVVGWITASILAVVLGATIISVRVSR